MVVEDLGRRKREHLEVVLAGDVTSPGTDTGLDRTRVRARALPEHDLAAVDLATEVLGHAVRAPLLISCMTGGVSQAGPVNRALATAAQEHRIALGLGSGRVALAEPDALETFKVRDVAPDVVLLANLGAVQLHTYGHGDCGRLVEQLEADALVLHLNAVQEAVQPGGDTEFSGLLGLIENLCERLDVPVLCKEVGFGFAPEDVRHLLDAGVAGIDVAGAGGTNWARVEGRRDARAGLLAEAFQDWGWPTVDTLRAARSVLDGRGSGALLVASGGLRHGVDALKCLCLGADLAGFGRQLLAPAATGPGEAVEAVGVLLQQLRIAVWATGAAGLDDLGEHLLLT